MARYRRKPILVKAYLVDAFRVGIEDPPDWFKDIEVTGGKGNWITQRDPGEFTMYTDNDFRAKFEPVDPEYADLEPEAKGA